jgi:glycosyltransferase involved in cell wall biosynthesis
MKKRVDLVLPVYNEEEQLERHVRKIHRYLKALPEYDWKIIIASNASTDNTVAIGKKLAREYRELELMALSRKGRGGALKKAWQESDAAILSYMDIDLSADLKYYPELIRAIESGFDLATGSRLAPGARVSRSFKREFISRSYNCLIKIMFRTRFSDAQCGFKAISAKAAQTVLPLVVDREWFFDSELLIIAEKAGLRIRDLPVGWVDDPGSTVKILKTARGDLEGLLRLWRTRPWKELDAKS